MTTLSQKKKPDKSTTKKADCVKKNYCELIKKKAFHYRICSSILQSRVQELSYLFLGQYANSSQQVFW